MRPTPLPDPVVVAVSADMARELGIVDERSAGFRRFFSGDSAACPEFSSWATSYALSIYGSPTKRNCPFGTGNGYGDGRAISIAQVAVGGKVGG